VVTYPDRAPHGHAPAPVTAIAVREFEVATAAGGTDSALCVHVATGNSVLSFAGDLKLVIDQTLAFDGPVTALASEDNTLVVAYTAPVPGVHPDPVGMVKAYAYTHSAVLDLAVPGMSYTHKDAVYCLETLSTGSGAADKAAMPVVFTGGNDAVVRAWSFDAATSAYGVVWTLDGHTRPITALGFMADAATGANILWSGSEDRTLRLWNLADGACVEAIQPQARPAAIMAAGGAAIAGAGRGHAEQVRSICCGSWKGVPVVITGSIDGGIQVWTRDDASATFQVYGAWPADGTLQLSTMALMAQSDDPETPLVVCGYADGSVIVRDLGDGLAPCLSLHGSRSGGHTKMVTSLYGTEEGDVFFTGEWWSRQDGGVTSLPLVVALLL